MIHFSECGRTLQESSGKFSSPEFYLKKEKSDDKESDKTETALSKEKKCQWRISATHGEKIVLNITSIDILGSKDCTTDYLEVRDGHWLKSPELGKPT